MMNINDLTTGELHKIIAIKEQIEKLQGQLGAIAAGGESPTQLTGEAPAPTRRKYHMTAAHKRKLIKALVKARKIRWARAKGKARKGKRRLSAAGRAAIIAATKARWAKLKAAKGGAAPQ